MPIKNRIAEMYPEIVEWRQHLHQYPELGYEVYKTAAFVAEKLRQFGCNEVVTGVGRTGVIGVIKGNTNTKGKVVGLRADMDALPITEATGLEYASKTSGRMHACGHDGHTAMLLGAAKYFAETRNFDGTVVLIFQPAEEDGGGGEAMVKDGMMDHWNIQEVYGLHNMPGIAAGQFATRSGVLSSASAEINITVTGKGGHASTPDLCVDTLLAASQIIVSLQSIVSRNANPFDNLVISIGSFHTDSMVSNVLAHTVKMKGTIRSFGGDIRDMAIKRVKSLVALTAESFGALADVDIQHAYPSVVNTPANTTFAADAAERIAGSVDRDVTPMLGGEDFSYMVAARPGAFMFLGNGDSEMLHHPEYKFNDEIIPAGVGWFIELLETNPV